MKTCDFVNLVLCRGGYPNPVNDSTARATEFTCHVLKQKF